MSGPASSPRGGRFQAGRAKEASAITAFTLEGYRVVENKGVVRGVIVRSRSVIGSIGASLQTLVGGNISLFIELGEHIREDACQLMLEHARQHGANAVIGIRYDATEVISGVTEVLCDGTAVVVAPRVDTNPVSTNTAPSIEPSSARTRHALSLDRAEAGPVV